MEERFDPAEKMKKIVIRGARQHNLKNITVELPRDQFIVITGLSGSGKSTLAFDTIYAEGQRRYVESLSAYARQFLGLMNKPDVDAIEGLSPAISIEQKSTSKNRGARSVLSQIYDYLTPLRPDRNRILPGAQHRIESQSPERIADTIQEKMTGTVTILSRWSGRRRAPTSSDKDLNREIPPGADQWQDTAHR